jgi:hypothetical protein
MPLSPSTGPPAHAPAVGRTLVTRRLRASERERAFALRRSRAPSNRAPSQDVELKESGMISGWPAGAAAGGCTGSPAHTGTGSADARLLPLMALLLRQRLAVAVPAGLGWGAAGVQLVSQQALRSLQGAAGCCCTCSKGAAQEPGLASRLACCPRGRCCCLGLRGCCDWVAAGGMQRARNLPQTSSTLDPCPHCVCISLRDVDTSRSVPSHPPSVSAGAARPSVLASAAPTSTQQQQCSPPSSHNGAPQASLRPTRCPNASHGRLPGAPGCTQVCQGGVAKREGAFVRSRASAAVCMHSIC